MDEILELQRQLATAQLQDTAHRISERNAVEIILKLIDTKRIELLFSKSGKEYLTRKQLHNEIEDEILSNGGRLTIVELGPILGMDQNLIEETINTIVHSDRSMTLLSGQVITDYYMDGIISEINDSLMDAGQLSIVSLAQKFQLPAAFIRTACEQRMGTIIQGYLEGDSLYTASFIQRHHARLRGRMMAITQPTPTRTIVSQGGFLETITYPELKRLITAQQLPGILKGTDARAIYVPHIFSRSQENGVTTFFTQNGYISYDSVERLQIGNARSYLSTKFPTGMHAETVFLAESTVASVLATLEDVVATEGWMNAAPLLPDPLTRADVTTILSQCIKQYERETSTSTSTILQLADTFAVTQSFITLLLNRIRPSIAQLVADEHTSILASRQTNITTTLPPPEAVEAPPSPSQRAYEKERKRKESMDAAEKKAAVAATTTSTSKGGKGKKGKEVEESDDEEDTGKKSKGKGKAKKPAKKGGKKSRISDDESDDDTPAPTKSTPLATKKASKDVKKEEGLTRNQLIKFIKSTWTGEEAPSELIAALASHLLPQLIPIYKEMRATMLATIETTTNIISTSSITLERRRYHDAMTPILQDLMDHITVFTSGITSLSSTSTQEQHLIQRITPILYTHLMKTLGQQYIDLLLRHEAMMNGIVIEEKSGEKTVEKSGEKKEITIIRTPLSTTDREHIMKSIPSRSSEPIKTLMNKMNTTAEEFLDQIELSCRPLDLRVKKCDRKRERALVFGIRKAMIISCHDEQKLTTLIQLVTVIVHSKISNTLIHTPAKAISTLIRLLKPSICRPVYTCLSRCSLLSLYHHRQSTFEETGVKLKNIDDDDDEDELNDEKITWSKLGVAALEEIMTKEIDELRAYGEDPNYAITAKKSDKNTTETS